MAIAVTIIVGLIGNTIGDSLNINNLGTILSISTMGGFILAKIKEQSKND